MSRACSLLGISRQSVYQREKRQKQRKETLEPIRAMVLEIRRYLPRVGGLKLYHLFKPRFDEQGIKLGRDGFFAYLKEQDLLVLPKRSYTKTTHSKHWMKKHPNLVQDLVPSRPEELVVSDITYVDTDEGVHYLSLVTDAYSRMIMGHEVSRSMKAEDVVKAMQRAMKARTNREPLIHHSDRGSQYCSELYQKTLAKQDITPSMTDGYDCYQNALAERVNGILKQEFLFERCKAFDDLKTLVAESIHLYNTMRPHLSLGMQTPESVHKKTSAESALVSS